MRRFLVVLVFVAVLRLSIPSSVVNAYYTGMPASLVIGQPDFATSTVINPPTANSFNQATGVFTIGNKLVVSDQTNHRVLIYNSVPTTNYAPADVVVGQADFVSNSANQGGTVRGFTFSNPGKGTSDGTKLIMADISNSRVLIWNTVPTTNDQPADVVIGQQDMVSNSTNAGGSTTNIGLESASRTVCSREQVISNRWK